MNNKFFKSYLSVGSNLGDREENIKRAIELLNQYKEIETTKTSSIYETEPVGFKDQPYFLNLVLKIKTSFSPRELLKVLQKIEKKLGRIKEIKWGPRIIDIDILTYDNLKISEKKLKIPHPEMYKRTFVLVPLLEIYPDKNLGKKFQSLKKEEIKFYKKLCL